MKALVGISDGEKGLLMESWYPSFPTGELDPTKMQFLTNALFESSAPLASYVLNRVGERLQADGPWCGDDVFGAAWSGEGRKRFCLLTRKVDGAQWRVSVFEEYGRPAVSVSKVAADGSDLEIARGEITTGEPGSGNRHGFVNAPPPVKGSVEAYLSHGAFDDFIEFCTAIRGSITDDLLRSREGTVTFAHANRLEALVPLLEADGGFPGRLCAARHAFVTLIVNDVAMSWMHDKFAPLADGLRQVGAEWGKAVMAYNDSDYSCCVVDFPDGSIGLFSDNADTCADERSHVAKIGFNGDAVSSIEVYVFDADEDYRVKMTAIGDGSAKPDFVYDYGDKTPSFPGGRVGHAGMTMLFWQFMADHRMALKDGALDEGRWYWAEPEQDDDLGPAL